VKTSDVAMSEREQVPATARRPRWRLVAVIAAVLAVIGGAAAVRLLVTDEPTEAAEPFGAPPEGMRWVGMSGVVVAVPDWWTTGETQCLAPVEDTVYFDSSAVADCDESPSPATVREVSALALLDATHGYGEFQVRDMQAAGTADGHEVLEADGCEGWFDGVCRRMFAVPSKGVLFAVTIADEGDGSYDVIRDSLRVLPDDLTTVPLAVHDGWTPTWGAEPGTTDALVDEIRSADLQVQVVTPEPHSEGDQGMYADLPPGSFLEASPALGSVIEKRGTVTVTVMGEGIG
jgi:hypothetical protein